jgi:hypothetical protein
MPLFGEMKLSWAWKDFEVERSQDRLSRTIVRNANPRELDVDFDNVALKIESPVLQYYSPYSNSWFRRVVETMW